MSDTLNPIVSAVVTALAPRIGKTGKPYLLAIANANVDGGIMPVTLAVGVSPKQQSSGLTGASLEALGFDGTLEEQLAAVAANPERAKGRAISVRWEDPTDANPAGGFRLITAPKAESAATWLAAVKAQA